MERPVLSDKNSKILKRIENKIDGYKTLDKKMDYVDSLVLWNEFDGLSDEDEDVIDEYLRDYV